MSGAIGVLGRLAPELQDVIDVHGRGAEGDPCDRWMRHGDAEPAEATPDSTGVDHAVHGPEDVTAVLDLFDRRYRSIRGDDS